MRPRPPTRSPAAGRERMRRVTPRQQVARSCATSSRTVKYQWPDAACLKFEISPSTHTDANRLSMVPRTCEVSSDTVSGRRSDSSKSDMRRGRVMASGRMKDERISCKMQVGGYKLRARLQTWNLQLGTCNLSLITRH